MRPVPEWEAAKIAGEQYYDTGKPCRNGHLARRYTANGKCSVCVVERVTRYNKRNLPKLAAYVRERRRKDPGPHRAASVKWAENNQERHIASVRQWNTENPERRREITRVAGQNRRAKIRATRGDGITTAEVDALYARSRRRCALCGKRRKLELDHRMPLALGGRHEISNIQLLCLPCNRRKGAKHPDDWAKKHGFLLL